MKVNDNKLIAKELDRDKVVDFIEKSKLDPIDVASMLLCGYAHSKGLSGYDLKTAFKIEGIVFTCKIKFDFKYAQEATND